jgi:hypothetical protein
VSKLEDKNETNFECKQHESVKEFNTDNTCNRLFCAQACSNCNLSLDECRQIGGIR